MKAVFDSVLYTIASLTLLAFGAMFFGIADWFGMIFSVPGFVVGFFLIFTTIAK